MIPKYNDFLLENSIINLILEGTLDASIEFLDRLKMISDKSEIAKLLYDKFYNEYGVSKDISHNYIDITDKDDMISFLSDDKSDKLSYDDSRYLVKNRGEIKIGRFAKSLLTDKTVIYDLDIKKTYSDKEYEEFVNLYKSTNIKTENKFKLVEGKDILKYYLQSSYAYQKGQLGSSCMKHGSCQDYFGIYVENPNVCNLLVYLNSNGEVLGRALVWKVSKSPCDAKYFMDRIYTSSDSDILRFKKYAEEKGWMSKYKQSCDISESYFFEFKGNLFLGEVNVKLKSYSFDQYPFVDTLSNLREDGVISNIASKLIKSEEMIDTDGEISKCYDCNGSGVEEYECDDCDGSGSNECDKCEGTGKKEDKDKKCKKCDGDGVVKCKSCEGKGEKQEDCSSCVGLYKANLKEIVKDDNMNKVLIELATKELARLKAEKKESKK